MFATLRIRLLLALLLCSISPAVHASVTGFTPIDGWETDDLQMYADVFSVAGDGRLAIGTLGADGATITVFNHADPVGRTSVGLYHDSSLKYLGGLAFQDANHLLVAENGARKTVLNLDLTTGGLSALAPDNAIRNISQVRIRPTDGGIFALVANNPGQGAVVRVDPYAPSSPASVTPFVTNLGTGYLGGLGFDAQGNVYVGDTSDPYFMGNAGTVWGFDSNGAPISQIGLAAGGGSGLYDLTSDSTGNLYATTGSTITRVTNGVASELGRFSGMYPFPTELALDGQGGLIVNGAFTGVGGLFRVRPNTQTTVPEPATTLLIGIGAVTALRRRRVGQR